MTRKAVWIPILLVVLLAISASIAFAASMTQPAPTSVASAQSLSTSGAVNIATLSGIGSGNYKLPRFKGEGRGHCHLEDEAAAY
jgi:phosphate-selective porin